MTTLYKRATPSQAMILRIVEGAIKNTCDAHGIEFDPKFARSVAKRAAGTLSEQIPAVLAAKPSEKVGAAQISKAARAHPVAPIQPADESERTKTHRGSTCREPQNGAVKSTLVIAPFRPLIKALSKDLWNLKHENPERYQAFVDVLKLISQLTNGD